MIKNLDMKEKEEGILELTVTVAKESLEAYYKASLQKVHSQVKMKGFRPGKTPLSLIKQNYSPQINYETINSLFPVLYQEIEKEYKIKAMSTPELSGLDSFDINQDFILGMTVETIPEVVDMPELDSISIKKITYSSDDVSLIEKELEILQSLKSEYKDIQDESISKDCFVKATITFNNEENESFKDEYFNIKETDPNYEISSHFVGKKIGESYEQEITFSESFHQKHLAGKTINIAFSLHEGKYTDKPVINDDLAKQFNFTSLDDLKEAIKKILVIRASMKECFTNADIIFQEIIKKASFSISKKVIKNQSQNELQALFQKIMKYTTLEEYLKEENITDDQLIEKTEKDAKISIQKHLISEYLKEKFEIQSSEEELNEFVKHIASQEIANQQEIIDYYNQNPKHKESLKIQLDLKKLSSVLLEKVVIEGEEIKSLNEEK